ncbi:hypothetical protein B9479_006410 [Cryptococcus floricola]|uniref:Uncharacterized protein n=1 Tax=Cryptococcus floricola TaxID=2591691 RepID=A0A5D3AQR3_9TREE|nr:hypothetical protein B9479_006410 [Cryptococcus floricola]
MSFSSRVAHTRDILHIVFSHISDGKDLTSLLRTSPLFFGLIAQKLYRSLPISNVLNPLSGTVVVERAPLPDDDLWANWDKLPSLPAVEIVIIHPADRNARQEGGPDRTLPNNALIQRLCRTATRLHLSTPCVTPGAKGIQSIPSLPCVETLVVKANAGEIHELKYAVEKLYWNHSQKEHPPCLNIKAVHILLWGDLKYPVAKLQSSDWDKARVDDLAMRKLILSTNAQLQDILFPNLCEIAKQLGSLYSIDELCLYNADAVLERLSKWTKRRKADDMKAMVERAFGEAMKTSAEGKVFWQTGLGFYEAFGDVSARDKTEEWYHLAVLTPSPNLVSLRARLAAKTKFLLIRSWA